MERFTHKEKLTLQVSLALAAGMVSVMPMTYGAPILDKVVAGGAKVDQTTTANVTAVTSANKNNVIDWKDFSVAKGEKIEFDGGAKTNNYLNIVTGDVQSHINGEMKGGNDVYIVNPKGVIFGNGATVDVGNLYVSTTTKTLDTTQYLASGASPLVSTASAATADVINMGQISADKVSVEGGTIKFLDTAKVVTPAASNVTLTANTAVKLGHDFSTTTTTPGYTMKHASGVAVTPSTFATITSASQLQSLNGNSSLWAGDYELGADIDMSAYTGTNSSAPIGNATTPFSGTFDGNYFTISNLTVSSGANTGLFGNLQGSSTTARAKVSNLGLVNPAISSSANGYSGGIAGYVVNADLQDVYVSGGTVTNSTKSHAGGLLGYVKNVKLDSAYNTATINKGNSSRGGGIASMLDGDVIITNVYNAGAAGAGYADQFGNTGNSISTSYYDTSKSSQAFYQTTQTPEDKKTSKGITFGKVGDANTYASYYSNWDISNQGGVDTVWRIYEGQTLPLLRHFLTAHGTKLVEYNYNFFDRNTKAVDANGLKTASTTTTALSGHSLGTDLTTVYNGDYFKTVDSSNNVIDPYANDSLIKSSGLGTSGVKNVQVDSTSKTTPPASLMYNLYYGDQDGYDLVGNYLTITPKTLDLTGSPVHVKRVYDGTNVLAVTNIGTAVGIISGDDAKLGNLTATLGTAKGTVGTYSTANGSASNGIVINNTGNVTLTGSDASNYYLPQSAVNNISIIADIEKRSLYLTSSNTSPIDKYYDGTSATINAPTGVIQIDSSKTKDSRGYDAGPVKGDTAVGLSNSTITTGYIDANGNATANATANSTNGATAVRYSGIDLDSTTAVNYQLVDKNGKAFSSGSAYYDATGTIKQRVLDPKTFVVKDGSGKTAIAQKTYDGTSSYTVASSSTITAAPASGAGTTGDTGYGIITADYPNIEFTATTGDFKDANGNSTVDATKSGYTTAATQVGYNAQAALTQTAVNHGVSASVLENYTINGNTLNTTSQYSVNGQGQIDQRSINVGMVTNPTGIDKTYDATDDVDSKYNVFGKVVDYAQGSNQLVSQNGSQPTWTVTGKYQLTNGEGAAKNVLLDAQGKEAAKNINFDVTLSGTHAQNYILNGTAVTSETTGVTQALSGATGTINKAGLGLTFSPVTKTYDGTTATVDAQGKALTQLNYTPLTDSKGTQDQVTVTYQTATYNSPDVLTAKTITYDGLTLNGTDANNYYLMDSSNQAFAATTTPGMTGFIGYGQGTITPLAINNNLYVDFANNISKVYDGTDTVSGYDANGNAVTASQFVQNAYVLSNGAKVALPVSTLTVDNANTKYTSAHSNNGTAQGVTYVFNTGSLSSNFTLVSQTGYNAAAKTLTVTANGAPATTGGTAAALQGTITPRAVTVSAIGGQTKVYDATKTVKDANGNTAGAGLVNMQTATSSTPITGLLTTDGSSNQSTALYQTKDVSRDAQGNVAQDKVVDYTLAVDSAHAGDYTFVDTNGNSVTTLQTKNNEITPAPLTLNAATIEKVYDGTTDTKTQAGVELQTTGKTISLSVTPLKGDTATVSYQTAEYTSPNVIPTSTSGSYGTQGVVYDGLVLSGTDAGNYFLADSQGKALAATTTTGLTGFTTAGSTVGLGIITPLTLTANDVYFNYTGVTKAYDGTWTVTSTKGPNNDATDYVTDAYIAAGNGLKINYQYTINRADYVNSSNTYDEHANGTATTKGVRYQVTLKPGSTSNYTLTNGKGTSNGVTVSNGTVTIDKTLNVGNITPLAVQVALTQPVSKTYNGLLDTGKQGSQLATFTGLLTTDGSSNQTTAVFQDKNVGTNKAVVYTFAVDSTHASDYEFYYNGVRQSKPTTNDGTIKAAPLQLTFTPVTKTYDTTTATVDSSGNALTTPAASKALNYTPLTNYTNAQDQVTVGYQTATYNSPDVATATTVTYDGLTLTGADAGNYYLVDGQGNKLAATTTQNLTGFVGYGAGTITPVSIKDSDIRLTMNNASKMYDGKTDVAGYQSDGKGGTIAVTADDFVSGAQTFVDFNGNGIKDGADFYLTKGSYTLTGAYTGTNAGTYTGGNNATQSATGTSGVNYTLTLNNGTGGSSNYNFQSGFSGTVQRNFSGTITPQEVKYTITPQTFKKTYDATTAVKDSVGNVLSGDSLVTYTGTISGKLTGINTTTAAYDTANAGTNKDVLYTLGLNNSNYQLIDSTGAALPVTVANGVQTATTAITEKGVGTIDKYQVSLQFGPVTKVYDNTTTVDSQKINYKLAQPGLSDGVTVSLTGTVTGTYASPDVKDNMNGAGKVTYTGFTINPAAAQNYELVDANNNNSVITSSGAIGSGTITQLPVTPDMFKFDFSKISKIYDGTSDVAYTDLNGTAHKADEFITGYVDLNKNGTKDGNDIYSSFTINSANYAGADVAYSGGQVAAQGVTYQVTLNNAASGPTSNYSYNGVLQTQFTLTQDQNGNALTGTITPRQTTVTIVRPHVTKAYDGTANVVDAKGNVLTGEALVTFDNLITADKANASTINQTTAAYTGANVPNMGTGYTVTYTLKNASGNYELIDASGNALGSTITGTGDINQRVLTLVAGVNDKKYDGNAALKTYNGVKFDGFVTGEELTPYLNGSTHSILGQYGTLDSSGKTFTADANVNRLADNSVGEKALAFTNVQDALKNSQSTGTKTALASNYTIADTVYFNEAASKGKIMPLAITADAVKTEWGSISKVYDGTTKVTGGTTTAGVQTSDPTKLLSLYYQSTVGDKKRIDISYALNNDGANYAQKDQGNNLTVNYSLSGITMPTFATANGYGNYTMSQETFDSFKNKTYSTDNGVITPKVLTVKVLQTTGQDKVYDGTRNADTKNVEVSGIVQSDQGVVTPTIVAYYDNKNASQTTGDRKVTYEVQELKGNDKGNYIFTPTTFQDAATGTIAKRKVRVKLADNAEGLDKEYDGTKNVTEAIGKYVVVDQTSPDDGLLSTDSVSLDTDHIRGEYDGADVKRDAQGNVTTRTVTFTNVNLKGSAADLANYDVDVPSTLTGTGYIRPRKLQASIKEGPTKIYDNTTAIEGETYATMNNISVDTTRLVGSDTLNSLGLTLVTTGDDAPHYDTKNAGTGLGVNYKLAWDNGNYQLVHTQMDSSDTQTATTDNQAQTVALHANNGVISGRVLTTSVIDEADKVYDGTTTVSNAENHISIGNLADGDSISDLNLSVTGTYSSADAADNESDASTQRDVTYGLSIYNTNYLLDTSTQTGKGTISRKGLTIVADPVKRVQNGALPTSYTGEVNGLVEGGTGSASDFTFATDPAAGVTSAVPGTYGIYGWYQNRTSGNYGNNYTFAQDDSNSTALEIFNMKEYHDRKVPLDNVLPQNAGMAQTNSTNFGEFYREPNAAVAYQNGGKTFTLNGGGTYTDVNSSQQDSKASVMNGTGSYSTAAQLGGSQVIGSIAVQDVGVINMEGSGILDLRQGSVEVATSSQGTVRGIARDNDEEQKNYSDSSEAKAQTASSGNHQETQGSASVETVGSGVNVAG